jgi:hypothetical protein
VAGQSIRRSPLLKAFLEEQRRASVAVIYLPPAEGGAKVGLDDYLAAGHGIADLLALATPQLREPETHQGESPTIVATGRLSDITNAAIRVLVQRNTTEPSIFQRGARHGGTLLGYENGRKCAS